MRILLLSACLGALLGGAKLDTVYSVDKGVQVEIVFKQTSDTTMTMERDGEPVERPDGGNGGMSSEREVKETYVDRYLAVEEGKPVKVHRAWTEVGGKTAMTMGDNSNERELESPFEGLEIELDKEGVAKVVAGTEPENEEALKGHKLALCIDALLPGKEVEKDATWDLEKDAIVEALHQDILGKLTPPPARPEGGEGRGQRGGGGRGGQRGGMRGGGGNMRDAEWKGAAKVLAVDEEVDGVVCTVVELKIEASGTRELPQGGGRRGGDVYAPAFENTMTYKYELEGKLCFDNKAKRPLKLELAGTTSVESVREMTREESTMRIESSEEGKLEYSVVVSEAKAEAKEEAKKE